MLQYIAITYHLIVAFRGRVYYFMLLNSYHLSFQVYFIDCRTLLGSLFYSRV
jgi:hypothetical protein